MNSPLPFLRFLLTWAALSAPAWSVAAPQITEVMASNRRTLADADGDFSDWIEIYNPDATAVDLSGWHLTDNAGRKTKWQFPAVTIPAHGYLVVFASEKNRTSSTELHTNFALSAEGEYVGLIAADGATVVSEFAPRYPAQSADVSYGVTSAGTLGYLQTATPGAANAALSPTSLTLARADGTTEAFASALPVLVLDTNGFGPLVQTDGEKEGSVRVHQGAAMFTSAAGLAVRGSSSADFPKKSYSIELHDETGGNRSTALLGLANVADWALVSPWSYDPSYLRNAYVYALSNSLGRWAPRTRFTEVFFRDSAAALSPAHYHGIGVLTERIKISSELVTLQELGSADVAGEAVTGGYILKIDPKDDDEFGWVTDRGIPASTHNTTSLVVVSPKAAKLAPEQRDYIQGYVQAFENALFSDRDANWAKRDYLSYIDRSSWVDYHLLQVLSKNPDGLIRSTYFTKDRGGKLKAGPVWDFDRAMGSTDVRSQGWDEWNETTDSGRFWETGWWAVLANDPDFMQAWIDRWQSLRREGLSNDALTKLARTLAAQIDPAAAARDAARWEDNASRYGNHRGEVEHLVSWLVNRATWIDRQFIAAPVAVNTAAGAQVIAPAGMQIVAMNDNSDPRVSGGEFAAGAWVGASLTVPAGTTMTIRVYNPSRVAGSVGSAWSSAVTVTSAAPQPVSAEATAGALAVVSSRALIAAGAKFVSEVVVTGTAAKTFIVRGVGRTLNALGVTEALRDPVFSVVASDGRVVATNSDWKSNADAAALAQQFAAAGAFPLTLTEGAGRDAAAAVSLAPGRYAVEFASESGAPGMVLAEIFALTDASAVRQLATQTTIVADETFVSGFVVGGTAPRSVLVRAIGGDAVLSVYAGSQAIAHNDDWSYAPNAADVAAAAARAGIASLEAGARDAAVLLSLAPGTYALQVLNRGATAPVRVEVVDVP